MMSDTGGLVELAGVSMITDDIHELGLGITWGRHGLNIFPRVI
jgi:hypothetical protein